MNHVETYVASTYGQAALRYMDAEDVRAYAADAFAGIFASPSEYARSIFAEMDAESQAEQVEAFGMDEATDEFFRYMAEAMSVEENGVVEFITTSEGVYVYDEALA